MALTFKPSSRLDKDKSNYRVFFYRAFQYEDVDRRPDMFRVVSNMRMNEVELEHEYDPEDKEKQIWASPDRSDYNQQGWYVLFYQNKTVLKLETVFDHHLTSSRMGRNDFYLVGKGSVLLTTPPDRLGKTIGSLEIRGEYQWIAERVNEEQYDSKTLLAFNRLLGEFWENYQNKRNGTSFVSPLETAVDIVFRKKMRSLLLYFIEDPSSPKTPIVKRKRFVPVSSWDDVKLAMGKIKQKSTENEYVVVKMAVSTFIHSKQFYDIDALSSNTPNGVTVIKDLLSNTTLIHRISMSKVEDNVMKLIYCDISERIAISDFSDRRSHSHLITAFKEKNKYSLVSGKWMHRFSIRSNSNDALEVWLNNSNFMDSMTEKGIDDIESELTSYSQLGTYVYLKENGEGNTTSIFAILQVVPSIPMRVFNVQYLTDVIEIDYSSYLLEDVTEIYMLSPDMPLFDPARYHQNSTPLSQIHYVPTLDKIRIRVPMAKHYNIHIILNNKIKLSYRIIAENSDKRSFSLEHLMKMEGLKLVNHKCKFSTWSPNPLFTLMTLDSNENSNTVVMFSPDQGGLIRVSITPGIYDIEGFAFTYLSSRNYRLFLEEYGSVKISVVKYSLEAIELYKIWNDLYNPIYYDASNLQRVVVIHRDDYMDSVMNMFIAHARASVSDWKRPSTAISSFVADLVSMTKAGTFSDEMVKVITVDSMAYSSRNSFVALPFILKKINFNNKIIRPYRTVAHDDYYNRLVFLKIVIYFKSNTTYHLEDLMKMIEDWKYVTTAAYSIMMEFFIALTQITNLPQSTYDALYLKLYKLKTIDAENYFRMLMSKFDEWRVVTDRITVGKEYQVALSFWSLSYMQYPFVPREARFGGELNERIAALSAYDENSRNVKLNRINVGISDRFSLSNVKNTMKKELFETSLFGALANEVFITDPVVLDKLVMLNSIYILYGARSLLWIAALSPHIELSDLIYIHNIYKQATGIIPEAYLAFVLSPLVERNPGKMVISNFNRDVFDFTALIGSLAFPILTDPLPSIGLFKSRVNLALFSFMFVTFSSSIDTFLIQLGKNIKAMKDRPHPRSIVEWTDEYIDDDTYTLRDAAMDSFNIGDDVYVIPFKSKTLNQFYYYMKITKPLIESIINRGYSNALMDLFFADFVRTWVFKDPKSYFELVILVSKQEYQDPDLTDYITKQLSIQPDPVTLSHFPVRTIQNLYRYLFSIVNVRKSGYIEQLLSKVDMMQFVQKTIAIHANNNYDKLAAFIKDPSHILLYCLCAYTREDRSDGDGNTEEVQNIIGTVEIDQYMKPEISSSVIFQSLETLTDKDEFEKYYGMSLAEFSTLVGFENEVFINDFMTPVINIYLANRYNNPACDFILNSQEESFVKTFIDTITSVHPDTIKFRIIKSVLVFLSVILTNRYNRDHPIHTDVVAFVLKHIELQVASSVVDLVTHIAESRFNSLLADGFIDLTNPDTIYKEGYNIMEDDEYFNDYPKYEEGAYLTPWHLYHHVDTLSNLFRDYINSLKITEYINEDTTWFSDDGSVSPMIGVARMKFYLELLDYLESRHKLPVFNLQGCTDVIRKFFAYRQLGYIHATWMHHVALERLFVSYFMSNRDSESLSKLRAGVYLFTEPSYGWNVSPITETNYNMINDNATESIGYRLFHEDVVDITATINLFAISQKAVKFTHALAHHPYYLLRSAFAYPNFWEGRSFRFINNQLVPYTLDIIWLERIEFIQNSHVSPFTHWFK